LLRQGHDRRHQGKSFRIVPLRRLEKEAGLLIPHLVRTGAENRENLIRTGVVSLLAGISPAHHILHILIRTESSALNRRLITPIRSTRATLIHDDELSCAPTLPRLTQITPEAGQRNIITSADIIIPGSFPGNRSLPLSDGFTVGAKTAALAENQAGESTREDFSEHGCLFLPHSTPRVKQKYCRSPGFPTGKRSIVSE